MKKKLVSVLLVLCLVFSAVPMAAPTASAGLVTNFVCNQLLSLGLRTAAKAINVTGNAIASASGEDAQKVKKAISIVNSILIGGSGTSKALGDIKELCKDILDEVNEMHEDMNESFARVEQMLGQQAADNARAEQDKKWDSDVEGVISGYNASLALEQYQVYMKAAINYADNPEDETAKADYEKAKSDLLMDFRYMYPGEISAGDLSDTEKLKDILFTSTSINDKFINMINDLSRNLVKGENSSNITLAETAARTAYEYFPFSHQQYQYVYAVINEQLMEISLCQMLYNEYLSMQGDYLSETYGEDSSEFKGYSTMVEQFEDTMSNSDTGVWARIEKMLSSDMVINNSVSMSLEDYMKPEDAVSETLTISDYKTSYKNYHTLYSKYISEEINFNRIMANGTVYYIIDPAQFDNPLVLSTSALEEKIDIPGFGDYHVYSMDHMNLKKEMSDGTNTFRVSGSDTSCFDNLIATNSFSLAGSIPEKYLTEYLPDRNDGAEVYIITSEGDNDIDAFAWETWYSKYIVIDATASHTGSSLNTEEITAQILQPDSGGDNKRYTVILAQTSDVYRKNLSLQQIGNGISQYYISYQDENGVYSRLEPGSNITLKSGTDLEITFKLEEGYSVASLLCVRQNARNSESVIMEGEDDFNALTQNEDGSYTINYTMPYSDSVFILTTSYEEESDCVYNDNGFCIDCGGYEPAVLSGSYYEISNAGQLFWIADLINNEAPALVNARLMNDIDLENREWTPIANFRGIFDGQGHTISGFNLTSSGDDKGFFSSAIGKIQNFTLEGTMSLSENASNIGGIVAQFSDGTISNVTSSVDIIAGDGVTLAHVGGVAASLNDSSSVEKCMYTGNMQLGNSWDCIGGIVAISESVSGIYNCANVGNIISKNSGAYIGGIMGYVNYSGFKGIYNCYNYGAVKTSGSEEHCGAIVGWERTDITVDNCYYLNSSCANTGGGTLADVAGFTTGRVAYNLNNGVTDGTQAWYQNVDNGVELDRYPLTVNTGNNTVYKVNVDGKSYSNDPKGNVHDHVYNQNGFCTICGAYEPAVLSGSAYEISNAGQLFWFADMVSQDIHTYKTGFLVKDIDLENREWIPIVEFYGTFDGQGHTISGLNITRISDNVGLFSMAEGEIRNLVIEGNIQISSDVSYVGAAAAQFTAGSITNVFSSVNISNIANTSVKHVGGVAGDVSGEVSVKQCVYSGNIDLKNSTDCIGGVVGYAHGKVTIKDCANVGTVTSDADGAYIGGILGYINDSNFVGIYNSYNYGTVKCAGNQQNAGAIVGLDRTGITVDNCYYLDTSCQNGGKGTKVDEKAFSSGQVAYDLNKGVTNGTQYWYQNIDNGLEPNPYPIIYKTLKSYVYKVDLENKTYSNSPDGVAVHIYDENGFCPCGQYQPAELNENGVYEISNAGQLYWLAALVNGDRTHAEFDEKNTAASAVLMNNIVVNDVDLSNIDAVDTSALRVWTPIGNSYDNFYNGQFDGQNYTISGLYFSDTNTDYVGLVGCTRSSSGKVMNVGVVNSCLHGRNYVAGIIGQNYNTGVSVLNCYSEASVAGNKNVGGIVGRNYGGNITNCYNTGSVTGGSYVAGIQGENSNTSTGTLRNCFSIGEITATGENAGAVSGNTNGTVTNSYYLDTTLADAKAQAKTADEFASGQVAYLLNGKTSDGTLVWYQNIDNGLEPDMYPVLDNTHGTVYYRESEDKYSNMPKGADAFDRDENGNLMIETYSDLTLLAQLVENEYEIYGSENYILTNNIIADSQSLWTKGIGSVENNKPFNGTFNGNGYIIFGLNMKPENQYGGLFEIIGEQGTVTEILLADCDYSDKNTEYAGSIAAVNNGTIDHCISGVNFTSGYISIDINNDGKNEFISLADLNSNIQGKTAGGFAAVNNGTITGCRNSSIVNGSDLNGGIAGNNTGKIYGCANNGTIGAASSKVSGGLAGQNTGTIELSYNSAKINCSDKKSTGSVAGINGTADSDTAVLKNLFYTSINGVQAVGSASAASIDSSVKNMNKNDMMNDSFVETLNSLSDDTVTWLRNTSVNNGYPTIKCNFLKNRTVSTEIGINVSGLMHQDLNVSYELADKESETYKELKEAVGNNDITAVYSVSLTDKNGNGIPSELWSQGEVEVTLPVTDKDIKIVTVDDDGTVVTHSVESAGSGKIKFNLSSISSFAVVSEDAEIDGSVDYPQSSPVQTGQDTMMVVVLAVICAGALLLIVYFKRRKDLEQQ